MKKLKEFMTFWLGIILIWCGAAMIHTGLAIMVSGSLFLLYSYVIYMEDEE